MATKTQQKKVTEEEMMAKLSKKILMTPRLEEGREGKNPNPPIGFWKQMRRKIGIL